MAVTPKPVSEGETPTIRVATKTYRQEMVFKTLRQVGLAVLLLFIVYLCLAATLVRFIFTTAIGPTLVKDNTFAGGEIPAGTQVVVSTQSVPNNSMLWNVKNAIVPQTHLAILQVAAGPYGKITWAPGAPLMVNGKVVENLPTLESSLGITNLNNQYLGVCVKGDCKPGSVYYFASQRVTGIKIGHAKISTTHAAGN